MDELTWDQILDHLKYEESEILKISSKKKYHGPNVVSLDPEDINILHQIDRDARRKIYSHLKEKKHILREALAAIELQESYLTHDRRYHNGSIKTLLYVIQKAISLVQAQKNNQSIYRIFQVQFFKDSVEYYKHGFIQTTSLPERLYTSKLDAFQVIKHQLAVLQSSIGSPTTIQIHCITNDKDETWFINLVKSCNIKKILEPVYRGQIYDSAMKQAFRESVTAIKEKSKETSKNSTVKIKSFKEQLILVERYIK